MRKTWSVVTLETDFAETARLNMSYYKRAEDVRVRTDKNFWSPSLATSRSEMLSTNSTSNVGHLITKICAFMMIDGG